MSILSFILIILKQKEEQIKISYHAAQRFLESVIKKTEFTKYEVHRTVEYLQRVFKDVVINAYS
jgi:hypothetical protein